VHAGDWEFQLAIWLPQVVDIACSLRGYKSDVVTRTMRSAGSSHFVGVKPEAVLNDKKQVQIYTNESVSGHVAAEKPKEEKIKTAGK
jgi:hypothetical protein